MVKNRSIVKEAKIINIAAAGCTWLPGLLLLLINEPPAFQKWMFGTMCIIVAAAKLIGYFSNDLYRLAFQFDLTLGIFAGVIGVLMFVGPEGIIGFLPTIIGIYVILDGALKLQIALDARKFGMTKWLIILITSIIICLLGISAEITLYAGLESGTLITLAVALMADGLENCFVTAYTVRVRARKKNFSDKYNLKGEN